MSLDGAGRFFALAPSLLKDDESVALHRNPFCTQFLCTTAIAGSATTRYINPIDVWRIHNAASDPAPTPTRIGSIGGHPDAVPMPPLPVWYVAPSPAELAAATNTAATSRANCLSAACDSVVANGETLGQLPLACFAAERFARIRLQLVAAAVLDDECGVEFNATPDPLVAVSCSDPMQEADVAAWLRMELPPALLDSATDELAFPFARYDELVSALTSALAQRWVTDTMWILDPVPAATVSFFQSRAALRDTPARADGAWTDASLLAACPMYDKLHYYQRRAVHFALNDCGGRCLLADEMGCGKTAEALCSAAALCTLKTSRSGNSLATVLVVCPATARQQWAAEVERWMGLEPTALTVVYEDNDGAALASVGSTATAAPAVRVVIISYAMLVRLEHAAFGGLAWDVVVVDESHNMRGPVDDGIMPLRTNACMALVRAAPAALLLSGTPALVRPSDLYFQVHSLRPGLLGATPLEFALNYMTACICPHVEFRDCHRPTELQLLLRTAMMVRTTKEVALRDQIPPKRRIAWRLATLGVAGGTAVEDGSSDLFQMRYHQAGVAKVQAAFAMTVQRVVTPLAAALRECGDSTSSAGVVLYAHHHDVLDQVERCSRMLADTLPELDCTVMRIDGTVPARVRQERLRIYQEARAQRGRPQLRIACLSMTAAGIAIDLTSATVCVFLELPPDASWLKQCEDRLHRRGQQHQVTSCLCVNSRCAFDAPHLSRLHRSMRSIDAVLEEDAVYAPQQHYSGGAPLRNSSRDNPHRSPLDTTNDDIRPSPLDVETLGQIDFLVSRWSGRIHLFRRWGGEQPCTQPRHLGSVAATALSADPHSCDFAAALLNISDPQALRRAAVAFYDAWNSMPPKQQRELWLSAVQQQRSTQAVGPPSEAKPSAAPRQLIFTRYVTTIGSDAPTTTTAADIAPRVRVRFVSTVQGQATRELDIPYRCIEAGPFGDGKAARIAFDCLCCGISLDTGHSDIRSFVASAVTTETRAENTGSDDVGPAQHATVSVASANADVAFYCSRECRQRYRARRMRQPLRRAVDERDCGICAACEVDCAAVLSALEAVVGADPDEVVRARLATLRAMHPAFHARSAAAARLVSHPSPGLFWHADHVTPVWQGGGGAIPEEVQTLCVACHLSKTNDEASLRRRIREE